LFCQLLVDLTHGTQEKIIAGGYFFIGDLGCRQEAAVTAFAETQSTEPAFIPANRPTET
jgi:hypothetical protein